MDTYVQGASFVGRDREIALLHAAVQDARTGRARVVLVEGVAGLGKTTLVRRLIDDVGDTEILWAAGDEDETQLTNGFVGQLMAGSEEHLAALGPLAGAEPPDPLFVGSMLLEVLGRSSAERPLLVIAEDVQFADEPSVRALCFAAKRLRHDHVLVLLTSRTSVVPDAVQRLAQTPFGSIVGLQPFDAGDVRALARTTAIGDIDQRDAQRLCDHCDGNPLHIQRLLAELSRDDLHRAIDEPLRAPASFEHLVIGRLARCTDDAVRLARAAAVLGVSSALDDAVTISGGDNRTDAVASLAMARIADVRDGRTGRQVVFTHPLVRAAVYHDLGPAIRSSLHARAAEVAKSDDERLRHRVAAADGPDGVLAGELEATARTFAARGDWHHAGCAFLQAAELATDVPQRERATLRAIHAFTVCGDPKRAADLASTTDAFADSVLRRFVIGSLRANEGDLTTGAELLRSAVELARATNDELLAPITSHLAIVELFLLRVTESSRLAREALAVGPQHWSLDTYGGAEPLNTLLFAYAAEGRYADGLAVAENPPDGGPPPGTERPDGLMGRGTMRLFADDPRGGRADFTIAAEHYRRHGPASLWCTAILQLARCEYPLGDWDEALAHATLAISVGEDAGLGAVLPIAYATAVQVLAARGAWGEAEARIAQAWSFGGVGVAIDIAGVSALLARARGDHEGVVRSLMGYVTIAKAMPSLPGGKAYTLVSAEALIELGRLDEADEAITGLVAPDEAMPAERFLVARSRARLAAAQGDPDVAEAAFQVALERAVGLVHALEVPILNAAYGAFLRSVGRHEDARMHLLIALERFERLGAAPYVASVNRDLDIVGPPVPHVLRGSPDLTPHERQVAELVASGMTNREAASRLVVTSKTVEYHLGHIYAKLGVSDRRELARLWPRRPTD